MSMEARFPRFTVAGGFELVPPTLMIAAGFPVLGGTTLAAVMVAWMVHARMIVRAQQTRGPHALVFAHSPATLGGDPASVIRELRQRVPDGRDDRDLFDPEDEEGWVHLHPSDW